MENINEERKNTKRCVTYTEEHTKDRKKRKREGKESGWIVFSWFFLCLEGFDDKIVDRWNCVNLSSVLCLIIWQRFFLFGEEGGDTDKREQYVIHHLCYVTVMYFTNQKTWKWYFISPKLQILEAWPFQDRKTIVLEKNWWQNCLGQLWWLFV